jgi:putative endonuclease
MSETRQRLGRAAESAVEDWLVGAGWRILERNARSASGGEVDLLAVDPTEALVAVEVRARTSARAGDASTSVDTRKALRLERTLVARAAASRVPHTELRVDLVTVTPVREAPGQWRLRRIAGISGR